jgi:proline racemase
MNLLRRNMFHVEHISRADSFDQARFALQEKITVPENVMNDNVPCGTSTRSALAALF